MISDAFFFLRMLVFTTLIVLFSQVKIGEQTIEDHFQGWVKSSMFVDSIQEAVDGGIALTKLSYQKIDLGMHGALAKLHSHHANKGKDRLFHFTLKRTNKSNDEEAGQKNKEDSKNLPHAESNSVDAE